MEHVTLKDLDSGSTAAIAARFGFNCYSFIAQLEGREIDVIFAQDQFIDAGIQPSWSGIPILFPFPNRIAHGRFQWEGKEYQLPPEQVNHAGPHAIHGFCLDRPWRVIKKTSNSATGQFQLSQDAPDRREYWPADFIIEVRYEVLGPALRCDITVTNPDDRSLPFGLGTHGYFRAPLASGSQFGDCLVEVPASTEYELIDFLPRGPARPVEPIRDLREGVALGGIHLDNVYGGLSYQNNQLVTRLVDPEAGLQMTQTAASNFREIVAFTPRWGDAVCMEPYTCTTDAINLQSDSFDAGLLVLAPGEQWRTWFELRVGRVTV